MKVLYLAPSDIQVARVDRQCIVAFCSALCEVGVEVELVALSIKALDSEPRSRRPLDLYRVRKTFPVRLVRVPVHQESRSWWIAINRFVVHVATAVREASRRDDAGRLVIYEKSFVPALALVLLRPIMRARPLLVFEAHLLPRNVLQRFVLRHASLVVANTHALAADLVSDASLDVDRVVGTHQGVDLATAEDSGLSQGETRKQLGLSLEKKLAVYTGKVYAGYEEVDYILEAARLLRETDTEVVLVGGRKDHVDRLSARASKEGLDNVTFTGFVPPAAVPGYQRAADVLLLYYPSGMELNKYRSPGKLFEYMASGRPIVAVDLPVLREVLGEEPAAVMIPPDSPGQLAEAIEALLADPEEGQRLARLARQRVEAFTWEARARSLIAALERIEDPGRAGEA